MLRSVRMRATRKTCNLMLRLRVGTNRPCKRTVSAQTNPLANSALRFDERELYQSKQTENTEKNT